MLKTRGFTLIEIMIAIAIIAILTAVGYPSYVDYVMRGKLTEAISGLSDMRVKMEQYFQDNRSYLGACVAGTVAPLPAATSNFSFACSNLGTSTFTVTASGIGSMQDFVYSIDQTNTRTTVGLKPGWAGSGSSCWVLKKDGSC
ncbi:MAG: hypothetical protein A2V78_01825 [Betaproteobacteria bacterium RBG_16_64_18]|nr:MAG: hypothetical protein A2V78_01825 [Betaproteobacteria bacterium RBG_16_64_18]